MNLRHLPLALSALILVLEPVNAMAQQNAAVAQARYSRGFELFQAGRYAEALDEFRASEQTFSSPNSRLFIARSLAQLGRNAEAAVAYELALHEAEDRAQNDVRYDATRLAAQTELDALTPRIARLTVLVPEAPAGLHVHVGDREVPAGALGVALAVEPGVIRVRVDADHFVTASREITLAPGEQQQLVVPLEARPTTAVVAPPPAPPPRHRAFHWTSTRVATAASAAVALVGFTAFGVLAGVTQHQYDDLAARCPTGPCADTLRADVATGQTLEVLTNVALGVGIAGAVGTGISLAFELRRERSPSSVHALIGPGFAGVRGRF